MYCMLLLLFHSIPVLAINPAHFSNAITNIQHIKWYIRVPRDSGSVVRTIGKSRASELASGLA